MAEKKGITIKSLVFPRNQWNFEYLNVLIKQGILSYRGNESKWMYKATDDTTKQDKIRRAVRLLDAYINISGHNVYSYKNCTKEIPFNFPSSRFLRPHSKKAALFDGLKLNRIKKSMNYAAKNKKIFHLWWHPHNFGTNTSQNINFLSKIVKHYSLLKANYGMESLNMKELSELSYGK